MKDKQIHEIKPVLFGGDPVDPNNKIALTQSQHTLLTQWWASIQRRIQRKGP